MRAWAKEKDMGSLALLSGFSNKDMLLEEIGSVD